MFPPGSTKCSEKAFYSALPLILPPDGPPFWTSGFHLGELQVVKADLLKPCAGAKHTMVYMHIWFLGRRDGLFWDRTLWTELGKVEDEVAALPCRGRYLRD